VLPAAAEDAGEGLLDFVSQTCRHIRAVIGRLTRVISSGRRADVAAIAALNFAEPADKMRACADGAMV
jgi:hypothetical protein